MTDLFEQLFVIEIPLLRKNMDMNQLQKCFDLLEKCRDEIYYEFHRCLHGELEYIKEQIEKIERLKNNG